MENWANLRENAALYSIVERVVILGTLLNYAVTFQLPWRFSGTLYWIWIFSGLTKSMCNGRNLFKISFEVAKLAKLRRTEVAVELSDPFNSKSFYIYKTDIRQYVVKNSVYA